LINLVVADLDSLGDHAPSLEELQRITAPSGALIFRTQGDWTIQRKPVSDRMDEWPQWDRAADGNPVSTDQLIAPTESLRWLAGTTTADRAGGKVGLRIASGRVFYLNIDYSLDRFWNRNHFHRSDLIARDAANGTLLWKRPIPGVPGGGDQPPRFALTCDDQRVYCFPEEHGPLHALDAATGETLVRYENGPSLPDVRRWDKWRDPISDVHFVVRVFDGKVLQTYRNEAFLSDAKTGSLHWKYACEEDRPIGWAVVGDDKVFLAVASGPLVRHRASQITPLGKIVALDAGSGERIWENDSMHGRGMFRMIYHRGSVIVPTVNADYEGYGGDHIVTRIDAKTGENVWTTADNPKRAHGHYTIVLARGDEIIVGQQAGFGVDFNTGEITRDYKWGQTDNSCADLKCAPDYTFYGLTFLDDQGNRISRGQTRAICDVGHFPAYGMLYNSPLGCLCAEYLNGYMALSSQPVDPPVDDAARLIKGDVEIKQVSQPSKEEEWPVYLGDVRRSTHTEMNVVDELETRWQSDVADWPQSELVEDWQNNERIVGLITAPTVASGKVFLAVPEQHRLLSLDAQTGKTAWSFTAGSRIDTPPTILPSNDASLCLFGCRDGWVYCLDAADGKLVWKFLAARNHKKIAVQSQIESAWPLSGTVMIDGDGIVVAAGRQSAIDGGIYFWKLDPADGRVLWKTRLWTDPEAAQALEDYDDQKQITRNRRTLDLLVHNGAQVCNWITPLQSEYAEDEQVDISHEVFNARAMRWSAPSKEELREIEGATWIRAANSNGLLSRRREGVGRHDSDGVCYSHLHATKLVLAGKRLYGLNVNSKQEKDMRGKLVCIELDSKGVPAKLAYAARSTANWGVYDAMMVAGDDIYLSYHDPRNGESALHRFSTSEGEKVAEYPLPARVIHDGLAAAYSSVYASCVDGSIVCLGEGRSQDD